MTDPNYTALLLIVDRSGSMADIRDDMVGALTHLVADQVAEPGLLTVDYVQFDDEIERTAKLADPRTLKISLEPRGSTALHDAVGAGIEWFGASLAELPEHARPSNVQVVVVTDGHENSSQRFRAADVRRMVAHQQEQYSWNFTFLGANQDAVLTGADLGFAADDSLTFAAHTRGVAASRAAASRKLAASRRGAEAAFTQAERDDSDDGRSA